jgi:hypothetical protein
MGESKRANIAGNAGHSSTRGTGKTGNIKSPTGSNPKPPDERIMPEEPDTKSKK